MTKDKNLKQNTNEDTILNEQIPSYINMPSTPINNTLKLPSKNTNIDEQKTGLKENKSYHEYNPEQAFTEPYGKHFLTTSSDTSNDNPTISSKMTVNTQKTDINDTSNTHSKNTKKDKLPTIISHVTFESYVDKYFKDIDFSLYEYITKIKQCTYDSKDKSNEITNREKLVSALIEQFDMEKIEPLEKYLKIDCFKEVENLEISIKGIDDFFEDNGIKTEVEDTELVKLYKKQMEINNNRKLIIKNKLKKRMIYKSYLSALKVLDDAMIKLYLKRLRNKKRYKNDEFLKEMSSIIKKRRELKEELKEHSKYEDFLFEVDELFVEDNVTAKQVNYNLKDFF